MRPRMNRENTYPFQVSVCDVICVKIVKTLGYVQQLGRITLLVKYDDRKRLTRLVRFMPGIV